MWILWIRTFMSWVNLVSGLMVCGVWQRMHISTVNREPPCPNRGLWQLLQAEVGTTDRITFTAEPLGTKLKTSLAVSANSAYVMNSLRSRCAVTPIACVTAASKFAGALVANVYV